MTLEEAKQRIEAARKAALEPKPEPKPDPKWWDWEEEYQQDCKNTNENH